MTKLSDLLRSGADRAPVGEASVSVGRAARRVRVQRGVRAAGNSVAGLGVVALAVLGIVQPGSALNSSQRDSAALAPGAAPVAGAEAPKDATVASDGRWMSWGACGSFPLQDYGVGGTDALSIAAEFDAAATPDGGATLDVPVTVTANQALDVTTTGPDAVVLWQGMVVAALTASQAEQALTLAQGDTTKSTASLPLVNCFTAAPLPASGYELVLSQAFMNAVAAPTPEPSPSIEPTVAPTVAPVPTTAPEPAPTATIVPGPAPTPQTTFPLNPNAGGSDPAAGLGAPSDGTAPSDVAPMPVEPRGWDYRITSDPITFSVAGDPVDNPFADYYPQPWTPPAQPVDILTPSIARSLFDAAATSAPWDMKEGSSRWILPNGYGQMETFAPTTTDQNYFGCSWDGLSGLHFPTRSADLGLLSVSAEVPARLSVSYGWVVDDNPKVTVSVTNTSSYSIPGFYGEPNRSLYLVKDGRVVAQAYPVALDPNAGMLMKQSALATEPTAQDDPATYWGTLAPAASLSGTYLWRDITGCSSQDGTATSLSSGKYTLLVMQSMSLQPYSNGTVVLNGTAVPGVGVAEPARLGNGTTSVGSGTAVGSGKASGGASSTPAAPPAATDPIAVGPISIDPMPPIIGPSQQDYLDLQVWTSLGTVTITTH